MTLPYALDQTKKRIRSNPVLSLLFASNLPGVFSTSDQYLDDLIADTGSYSQRLFLRVQDVYLMKVKGWTPEQLTARHA